MHPPPLPAGQFYLHDGMYARKQPLQLCVLCVQNIQPCHLGPILGTTGVHATLPPRAYLRKYRSTVHSTLPPGAHFRNYRSTYRQPYHLVPIFRNTGLQAALPPGDHFRNNRSTCNSATWGPYYYRSTCTLPPGAHFRNYRSTWNPSTSWGPF